MVNGLVKRLKVEPPSDEEIDQYAAYLREVVEAIVAEPLALDADDDLELLAGALVTEQLLDPFQHAETAEVNV